MRIGFIGGGQMAEAILFRTLQAVVSVPADIVIGEPDKNAAVT